MQKAYILHKRRSKKLQLYQLFSVNVVPPVFNLIKNKTPGKVFSYEFCEFFQPLASLNRDSIQLHFYEL